MANNPWDVSDILLQNRSGQIMGQAYAGLGQQVGTAFKDYAQQKKQNQQMEGEIKSNTDFIVKAKDFYKNDPEKMKQMDALVASMNAPTSSLHERFATSQGARKNIMDTFTLGEMASKAKYQEAEAAKLQAHIDLLKNAFSDNSIGAPQATPTDAVGAQNLNSLTKLNQTQPPAVPAANIAAFGNVAPRPASVGVPEAVPAAPTPQITLNNPLNYNINPQLENRRFVNETLRTSGALPDSAGMNDHMTKYQAWLNTPQETGLHTAPSHEFNEDGYASHKVIYPILVAPNAPNKRIIGKEPIKFAASEPIDRPMIDQTGKPFVETIDSQTKTTAIPYNPQAPKPQAELTNAYGNVHTAMGAVSNANLFKLAVDAYNEDPTNGSRLNAFLGTEMGSKIKQLFTGTNSAAQMKAAFGRMYKSTISGMVNEKTGGNALSRITQSELQNLQAQYGATDMPPEVLSQLADNLVGSTQHDYEYKKAYYELRSKGMSEQKAEKTLFDDPRFSTPYNFGAVSGSGKQKAVVPKQNFVNGKIYIDGNGNAARYNSKTGKFDNL